MSFVMAQATRRALPMSIVVAVLCALGIAIAGCEASATAVGQEAGSVQTTSSQTEQGLDAGPSSSSSSTSGAASSAAASSRASDSGFFDTSVVHNIVVSFSPENYDAMIQTYQKSGEKDWIDATVTIDGKTYDRVGIRLKGNSSIMGLRQRVGGQAGDGGLGGNAPPGAGQGLVQRPDGPGANASADVPEGLPWLIDLDKKVDHQNHEGIVELVVRSNTSQTALNEAVALDLLSEAGLASQQAVYASFSINGSEPVLRLVVENPDDLWMSYNFDIGGALYKAESTGDYSYRGDDPSAYDEVFDQEAGKANADLSPLVEFLDFINNADEDAFNAELAVRLDIDAFATYLAMQELINNFDDIDGPGNNSYLYYDTKTARFTVIAWDHNLAFGTGGRGGFQGMQPPAGAQARPGAQGPAGGLLPEGMQGQGDTQAPPDAQRQLPGMGRGGMSNVLVERFKANPEWQQLYEDRLAQLRAELYESGRATEILLKRVAVLKTQATHLVDAATVDQEAANISRQITVD